MSDQRVQEEYILTGWEQIHKQLFCDRDGKPVISLSTLRQQYGPGMKKVGAVFRLHIGRGKRPTVCGYASVIKRYFALQQLKNNQGIDSGT